MAGCFTPGGNECHYPIEEEKEKDCGCKQTYCESNKKNVCNNNPGSREVEGRRVEVDREGVDLYISIRLKPINIILTILTLGVVAITVLLVRQWFIGQGFNI